MNQKKKLVVGYIKSELAFKARANVGSREETATEGGFVVVMIYKDFQYSELFWYVLMMRFKRKQF